MLLVLSGFFLVYLNLNVIKNKKMDKEKLKNMDAVKNIQKGSFGYTDMLKSINEFQGIRISSINAESESNSIICVETNYIGDMNKFDMLLKQIANYQNVADIKDIDIYGDGEKKEFKMKLYFVNNR